MDKILIRESPDGLDDLLSGTSFRILRCQRTLVGQARRYTVCSPFTRIIFHLHGGCQYRMHGRDIVLRPGMLMLVPSETGMECEITAGLRQYFTYCRIEYAGVDLFKLVKPAELVVRAPDARALFRRMVARHNAAGLPERLEGVSCLIALARKFCAPSSAPPALRQFRELQRLQPVLRHIEEHLAGPLSVASLAEVLYLSPKYFCNHFASVMGMGPMAYVNRRRVQKAKELLLLTPLSIKEVAQRVGFCDQLYFSRVFRQIESIPPREFRAQRDVSPAV